MSTTNTNNERKNSNSQYKELFDGYYEPLVGFACSYLNNRGEAEDVVQDIFMKLWKIKNDINYDLNVKSLLFTSTKNMCITKLRLRKIQNKYCETEQSLQSNRNLIALEYSTITQIELNELEEKINLIIKQLPEDYRIIFEKNRNEGKSYTEIANELNISVKTVEKKINRTLKLFKKNLKDYQYILFMLS